MFRPSTFKLLKIVSRSKVGFRVLKTEQANILPQKISEKNSHAAYRLNSI